MKTGLTINFASALSGSSSGTLSLEVDGRETGFNSGVTEFYLGDSPAFLIRKSSNVTLKSLRLTEGLLQYIGIGVETVEQQLSLVNDSSVSLQKPYYGGLAILGSMGDSLAGWRVEGNSIVVPAKVLAILNVTYQTVFEAWRITGASAQFPVIVYAEGETP